MDKRICKTTGLSVFHVAFCFFLKKLWGFGLLFKMGEEGAHSTGMRVEGNKQPQVLVLHFCLVFWGRIFIIIIITTIIIGLENSRDSLLSASCLTIRTLKLQTRATVPSFMWVLGILAQVFTLSPQTLDLLSLFFSPPKSIIFNAYYNHAGKWRVQKLRSSPWSLPTFPISGDNFFLFLRDSISLLPRLAPNS